MALVFSPLYISDFLVFEERGRLFYTFIDNWVLKNVSAPFVQVFPSLYWTVHLLVFYFSILPRYLLAQADLSVQIIWLPTF